MTDLYQELDDAISGDGYAGDGSLDDLVDLATDLRVLLSAEVPASPGSRAMFIEGVAAGARPSIVRRALVSAAAATLVVAGAGLVGHGAAPGSTFYPVRRVLGSVGLAQTPAEEADAHIAEATAMIRDAEGLVTHAPRRSSALALRALTELGRARAALGSSQDDAARSRRNEIMALEDRAKAVLVAAVQTPAADDTDAPAPEGDDHTTGDAEHGQDGEDHGKAGEDRGPGDAEHGQDGEEHGKAGEDHGKEDGQTSGRRGSDGEDSSAESSGRSGEDHGRSGEDHGNKGGVSAEHARNEDKGKSSGHGSAVETD